MSIRLQEDMSTATYKIYVGGRDADGNRLAVRPVNFEIVSEGELVEPTMVYFGGYDSRYALTSLMDDLWLAGIRPSDCLDDRNNTLKAKDELIAVLKEQLAIATNPLMICSTGEPGRIISPDQWADMRQEVISNPELTPEQVQAWLASVDPHFLIEEGFRRSGQAPRDVNSPVDPENEQ